MMASMASHDTFATWMPRVLEMNELDKVPAGLPALGFFSAWPIVGSASDRFRDTGNIVAMLRAVAGTSIVGTNYAPSPLLLLRIFLSGFTIVGALTITLGVAAENERGDVHSK